MDYSMLFERTAMSFIGDKAYQIAGQFGNKTHRINWVKKIINNLSKRVNKMDTSLRHKQNIMQLIEDIERELYSVPDPDWGIIFNLLLLIGKLVGTGGHTPVYVQTINQYYTERMKNGGDALEQSKDKQDAISIRAKLARDLKSIGISNLKISLILNNSEYEVKMLLKMTG